MALLDDVKTACRVTSTAFDTELTDLINAAKSDLKITDIDPDLVTATTLDPLVKQAIITYCRASFGFQADSYYQRMKASYDEQKAQLLMSSTYTEWGGSDA